MQFKLLALAVVSALGFVAASPAFDTSCLPFADNCVGGCCNANSKPEDIVRVAARGGADLAPRRDCWPFADKCGAGCC
jgi:hypothetical protein